MRPAVGDDETAGDQAAVHPLREIADRMFSRASGASLVGGNDVRLLVDARENYPAWLAAIESAREYVHFENYFIADDAAGRQFASAFAAKAREGVPVRVLYDWLGGLNKASRGFWNALRAAGVDVRVFNPARPGSPVGWLSRNHRKTVVVDGRVGHVSGLCVAQSWVGDPSQPLDAWRDTGIEIHGPAVADLASAFARSWSMAGTPLPESRVADPPRAGDVRLRIVSSEPATASMLRLDQLVAAIARQRLWLTDAYYSGVTSYVQALRAAARDGVDVRLLVPHASDIRLLQPFSRAGYRTLLDAGVRVFEWNGAMLHAKTAVADGRWARVGSTNLNVASWLGNCELDAVIEDEAFAANMERLYLADLARSTEVVLDDRRRMRTPAQTARAQRATAVGSSSGMATGALRLGHAMGAAVLRRRVLGSAEWRIVGGTGIALLLGAMLAFLFPRALAYPAGALCLWGGLALLWKAYRQRSGEDRPR